MRNKFLAILFLFSLSILAFADSETTIGGQRGSGHIIEINGTKLRQDPVLNFNGTGVSGATSGGKTVITISGGTIANNTNTTAGIVASGAGQNALVWKTDATGNPAWRVDATGAAGAGITTINTLNASDQTLATANSTLLGITSATATHTFTPASDLNLYSWTNVNATNLKVGSITQAYDADLTTWAGVTPSANGQSLVSSANYASMRGLLDLEAGTDFYSIAAANSEFINASELTAVDGLTNYQNTTTAAAAYEPKGVTVADISDASANGRSLISAANYAAMRGLLDLEAGTDFYSIAAANSEFINTTELDAVDNLNNYYNQTESNAAYQAKDADLTLLAGSTAWRVFYSNGTSVITELALGADGTYLRSNGASSAPTFATPAGGANDTAYGAGWNGTTDQAPSQNALWDKIETLGAGSEATTVSDTATLNLTLTGVDIKGDVITLKDLVTTAPLTGGTNDILVGADSDITIAMPAANTTVDGYLTTTDWNTFNGKMAGTLLKDLVTTAPLAGGTNDILPGADSDITLSIADAAADGSTKGAASFVANDFTSSSGNIGIDYPNGQVSNATQHGFLSDTDWGTFNGKLDTTGTGTGLTAINGTNITSGTVADARLASTNTLDAEWQAIPFITQTAQGNLSAEQSLGALTSGILGVTTTTGVLASITTSAGIAGNITDETGSGSLVFANLPTFNSDISFEGTTVDDNELLIDVADPGADVTIVLPATSGTFAINATTPVTLGASTGAIGLTVSKDIVAGVGLSGGEDNVLPGADADTTLTFAPSELENLTWGGGAGASIVHTFNVSGTDTTMTMGSATTTFSGDVVSTLDMTVTGSDLTLGVAGVRLTGDGDGALTILGLGDGSDENLLINFDDTSNEVNITSGTGVNVFNFTGIGITTNGNLTSTGSGTSYFNEKVAIGQTTATTLLDIKAADNTAAMNITINANQAGVTAADTFINFNSTTGNEGSIAGTAVAGVIAYSTFLGQHYSKVEGERPEVGQVLEMTGQVMDKGHGGASYLARSRICKTPGSGRVYGAYGGTNLEGNDLVMAVGAGVVLVSSPVKAGDLLEADGKGYARKQLLPFVMSSTLGKATEDYDGKQGIKLIGCVFYSG
jgi:hypothetical protein